MLNVSLGSHKARSAAGIVGVAFILGAAVVWAEVPSDAPGAPAAPFDRPVALALDTRTGHAFVVSATRSDLTPPTVGGLRMLDVARMRVVRSYPMNTGVVAIDVRRGRAFALDTTTGRMRVLDTRSGRIVRTIPVGANNASSAAVAVAERTDRVFVLDGSPYPHHGLVWVFDAVSGRPVRTVAVGVNPTAIALDEQRGHVFVVNLANASPLGSVSMLDATSGRVLRTVAVGPLPNAIAIDWRSAHAFVVDQRNTLNVLDTRSGALLRTVAVGAFPYSVAVDQRTEHVYVGNMRSADVSVLDGRTATMVRTIRIGRPPSALAVDERTGRLWVATWDFNAQGHPRGVNDIDVVNAANGAILQTLSQRGEPAIITLDERARRAFVLSGDGYAYAMPVDRWGWIPPGVRRFFPFIPPPQAPVNTLRPVSGGVSSIAMAP